MHKLFGYSTVATIYYSFWKGRVNDKSVKNLSTVVSHWIKYDNDETTYLYVRNIKIYFVSSIITSQVCTYIWNVCLVHHKNLIGIGNNWREMLFMNKIWNGLAHYFKIIGLTVLCRTQNAWWTPAECSIIWNDMHALAFLWYLVGMWQGYGSSLLF